MLLDWCKSQKTPGLYLRIHYASVLYIKNVYDGTINSFIGTPLKWLLGLLILKIYRVILVFNVIGSSKEHLFFLSRYSCEIPASKTVPDSLENYHCLQLVIKAIISSEKLKQLVVGKALLLILEPDTPEKGKWTSPLFMTWLASGVK